VSSFAAPPGKSSASNRPPGAPKETSHWSHFISRSAPLARSKTARKPGLWSERVAAWADQLTGPIQQSVEMDNASRADRQEANGLILRG
jgi:cytochrome c peroxidase